MKITYLDIPQNGPTLSAKAQQAQDVLAGIAAVLGSDSTFDLSRLLRVPGTLNRKDERNGVEPVPCDLIDIDPSRRYSFEKFERFADHAPALRLSRRFWAVTTSRGNSSTKTRSRSARSPG